MRPPSEQNTNKMRAIAGLLLLLISLSGSQAQDVTNVDFSNILLDVTALKSLVRDLMLKQQGLETLVDELKDRLMLGTQSQNHRSCRITVGFRVLPQQFFRSSFHVLA